MTVRLVLGSVEIQNEISFVKYFTYVPSFKH